MRRSRKACMSGLQPTMVKESGEVQINELQSAMSTYRLVENEISIFFAISLNFFSTINHKTTISLNRYFKWRYVA
jgi:hypothetical protein